MRLLFTRLRWRARDGWQSINIAARRAFCGELHGRRYLATQENLYSRGAIGWVQTEIDREPWEQRLRSVRRLRCVVGIHILYALELMIVSDIIDSFVAVSRHAGGYGNFFHGAIFYSLVQLGMVVVIRTVIDYFLGKEINELHETAS